MNKSVEYLGIENLKNYDESNWQDLLRRVDNGEFNPVSRYLTQPEGEDK